MFRVGFCGYNRSEMDNLSIYRPSGSGDYLFLLLSTPFHINQDHQSLVTKPYSCVIFSPNKFHHYQAVKTFHNSFMHFTADHDFISEFNVPVDTIIYPNNFNAINCYVRDIFVESARKYIHFENKIDCLIRHIFIELSRDIANAKTDTVNSTLYSRFMNIRLSIISNCDEDWSIEKMCKLVHMEKSQFYSYYLSYFNTTPKADLVDARIEKAKNLLATEHLLVHQVAEMCGYKNVAHFTRYFKKITNFTPSEYVRSLGVRKARYSELQKKPIGALAYESEG